MHWIAAADDKDRLGSCEGGSETLGSIKCWKVLSTYTNVGFSTRAQLHEISQDPTTLPRLS
jgi:hypothetical protein